MVAAAHSRVGRAFLYAGIGWGGSCFPKDLASLSHTASEYQYDAHLLDAVQKVNNAQRMVVIRKLQETQARMGYTLFCTNHNLGRMPTDLVRKSIELFGKEVIPAFQPVAV